MAINILFNSKVILLVLFALCALFLTNTQATSSLSELSGRCESKFWFKDLKDFKKSIKSKCLKEKSHNYEKRHRQHDVCKNNSHDKKLLLSKWEKFSDCRCETALVKLSDFKVSKFFVCYQIASFNKATGEFVAELIVFKKKSEHNYDVVVRFPKNVKIYGQKGKYNNDFYRLKEDKHPSHIGKFLVEKVLITGRIPKYDSMNKVTVDKISPDEFILLLNNGRVRSLKKGYEFAIIPLSKFVPSKNYLTKEYKDERKDKDTERKEKQPSNEPYSPAEPSAEPSGDTGPGSGSPNGYGSPGSAGPGSGSPPAEPSAEPSGGTGPGSGSPGGYGSPGGTGPGSGSPPAEPSGGTGPGSGSPPAEPSGGTGPGSGSPGGYGSPGGTEPGSGSPPAEPSGGGSGSTDGYGGTTDDTGYGATTPTEPQAVTGPEDTTSTTNPTSPTPSDATSAGQESSNNANKPSGGVPSAEVGSIVFGVIIAIGAAFIGYNTYERIRWRRQYRRRQAAAQQNTSLANVPDYNGYGRAY